jgi:hypothetical protein
VVFLVAVIVGLVFGGGDQYLGSINASGLWTVSLSLMSAPWLLLPFVFGCTQLRARRAAAVGLVATMSALAGYFLMIMGPLEGGRWTLTLGELHGLLVSNRANIAGGFLTAPLYGLLGQAWRVRRSPLSALLVAGALCLEPLALVLAHRSYPGESVVWPFEVGAGLALAVYFTVDATAFHRRGRSGAARPASH